MQKVQKGGTGGVVVTVVIVSVDSEYDARSSWLAQAVKQWRRDDGPRVRVLLHEVTDDTCVVGALTAAILPKLNGPVVIMRGNTTAIVNTDIRVWIEHWMASDVPVWCTAVDTSSVIAQWYAAVTSTTKPVKRHLEPVWGAFSGMPTALMTALVPYAGSGYRMDDILRRLVDAGSVHLDTAPLIDIGIHQPCMPSASHALGFHFPAPAWPRLIWAAKTAVNTRDGIIITAVLGFIVVLVCVIVGLSVVVGLKKAKPT